MDGLTPATDDLYEMANLYPRTTGLPMTVWVSPRGGARHDARVKVSLRHGDRMVPDETAVVAIRPEPSVVEDTLPSDDVAAVAEWVNRNRDVLLAYGEGGADTADLIQRLVRV